MEIPVNVRYIWAYESLVNHICATCELFVCNAPGDIQPESFEIRFEVTMKKLFSINELTLMCSKTTAAEAFELWLAPKEARDCE